jgi:N-sulfoglucosamine sulfohydrolase
VPLIIRWPRNFPAPPQIQPGAVNEDVVSLLDVTATTLAIAGLERPAGMHSRNLLGDGCRTAQDLCVQRPRPHR